jgi:hypothetical protein
MLTARRSDGDLLGYAAFTVDGREAIVLDLFGVDDPAVLAALLDGVVDRARRRGAHMVSAPLAASHPWHPLFRAAGFMRRDTQPLVIHVGARSPVRFGGAPWCLMHGDRDS